MRRWWAFCWHGAVSALCGQPASAATKRGRCCSCCRALAALPLRWRAALGGGGGYRLGGLGLQATPQVGTPNVNLLKPGSHGILPGMKQSSLDLNLSTRETRKQELLAQMDWVVPWAAFWSSSLRPITQKVERSPTLCPETMLRIHCMQQWFTLSDLAMEEAFL